MKKRIPLLGFELERAVIRYVVYLEKRGAIEEALQELGDNLIPHLERQPGRRMVIAGWDVWLVRKRTIRARPVNPLTFKK